MMRMLLAGLETCDKVREEQFAGCNENDNDKNYDDENYDGGSEDENYDKWFRLAAHNQLGILWCQRDDMVKVESLQSLKFSAINHYDDN